MSQPVAFLKRDNDTDIKRVPHLEKVGSYLKTYDGRAVFNSRAAGFDDDKIPSQCTVAMAIAAGLEPWLMKHGVQPGYALWFEGEEIDGVTPKVVQFGYAYCWETGRIFYRLAARYPEYVFNAMKPLLRFHKEEEEEEGNWQGWYTFHPEDVADRLQIIGWDAIIPNVSIGK